MMVVSGCLRKGVCLVVVWYGGLVSFCPERLHSNIHEHSKGLDLNEWKGGLCQVSAGQQIVDCSLECHLPWEGQESHLVGLTVYRILICRGRSLDIVLPPLSLFGRDVFIIYRYIKSNV